MPDRLTIKEFAAMTGVSTATVSRAFGNQGRISKATRRYILAEADRCGYRPSYYASNLSKVRSTAVGFFYPEIYANEPDGFINELIFGITRRLDKAHSLSVTPFSEVDDSVLESCLTQLLDGRIGSAMIVAEAANSLRLAEQAKKLRLPFVIIGDAPEYETHSIRPSNEEGAFQAGQYFRRMGKKHPVYVTGHLDAAKQRGFERGFGASIQRVPGGAGFRFGEQAFFKLRQLSPKADCVLCANDILAAGLLSAALRAGVKIPEELSVIGFDDIAMSRYFTPAISSVSLHLLQLGARAVELLEQQFAGIVPASGEMFPSDLILRHSS